MSIYVSWCYRCGAKHEKPGREVECKCGAKWVLTWPATDSPLEKS